MIRLYNDDCLNILKNYNGEPFDHVVVDLPYFKIVKNEFDNQWKTLSEYLDWVRMCFTYIKPHLKEQSNIIAFTSRQYNRHICTILDELGFCEKRIIIWARKRGFNNTRGRALASGYEPICYYSVGDNGIFNNIKIRPGTLRKEYMDGTLKDGITMSDVWSDISALPHNSKEKVSHPTQKPIKLMERIIMLFSNQNDTILDFCMGSGTTGVACANLGRNFIGIEKYEDYFNIAQKRLDRNIEPNPNKLKHGD